MQGVEDDAFQFGMSYEVSLVESESGESSANEPFFERMGDDQRNYIELAIDYAAAGLFPWAVHVLRTYLQRVDNRPESALPLYLLADYFEALGSVENADMFRREAAGYPPNHCFPSRLEEIAPLQRAADANTQDSKAPYYLGNLWYDRRQYDLAIECWERSRDRDGEFPTVWRNLGLAYFNKRHDAVAAWQAFTRAFELDPADARVLFEWDQLAKRLGHPPKQRFDRLGEHRSLVAARDDLSLEYVTLLNVLGRPGEALAALLSRNFHPWEGGEGKVPAQYSLCLTQLAKQAIDQRRFDEALALLERSQQWPESLGEGKLPGNRENHVHYLRGVACRGLGRDSDARSAFEEAAAGLSEPTDPMYYNDQPPDMIFYQGLALAEWGLVEESNRRFQSLIDFAQQHQGDEPRIDYFAVSLPDFLVFDEDLTRRNQLHCRYMRALGLLGLGRHTEAAREIDDILADEPSHLGAVVHRPLAASTVAEPGTRP